MAEKDAFEQILKELHDIPEQRWGEVLTFIRSLKPQPAATDHPVVSGADLVGSDLIGIWAARSDITDSQEYARKLRQQAEQRSKSSNAA
jgi:hypothetical protein